MAINLRKYCLAMCVVILAMSSTAPRPVWAQRWWHQGDTWLKWNHDQRQAYVFGYISGYLNGHDEACRQVTRDRTTDAHADNCADQRIDFSKGTDFVSLVTEFYNRYPEDRELDIAEVLGQLTQGLTLEEVHKHPFPRHRAADARP